MLLLALVVVLGMMGFISYLSTISARESNWLEIGVDLQLDVMRARRYVDLVANAVDPAPYFPEISTAIEHAHADVVKLLKDGIYRNQPVVAIDSEYMRVEMLNLAAKIETWRGMVRQAERNPDESSRRALTEFTATIAEATQTINHGLRIKIDQRRSLERTGAMAVMVGLALVLLATFVVTRRAAILIKAKSCEVAVVMHSLAAQKHAFDQHSIVAMTGLDGLITHVNDKFCEISGYSRAELMGQNHRILNSGYHPAEFFRAMWQTIASGRSWHGEVLNRAKDGSLYWVDTTIVPYLDEAGQPEEYVAIRTDITQRKCYEATLKAAEGRLKRQNRALRDLAMRDQSGTSSLPEVIHFYTETVARTLGVNRVGVWCFNADQSKADSVGRYDMQRQGGTIITGFVTANSPAFFARLAQENLIPVTDLTAVPALEELSTAYLLPEKVAAMLALSIRVGGVVIGFMLIEQLDGRRDWSLDEQNFATSVCDLLSGVVETINRNRVESALRVIAQTAPAAGTIFEELARQICKGLGAAYVAIGRLNDGRSSVRTLGVWHENSVVSNFSYALQHPVAETVVVRQLSSAAGAEAVDLPQPLGLQHYISAPIYNRNRELIGVIVVLSRVAIQNSGVASSMLQLCAARAAAELERSIVAERLKAIVEGMSDFIWETDAAGRVSYCSERVRDILGYAPEEIVGRHFSDFITDSDEGSSGQSFIRTVMSGQAMRNFELWITTKHRNSVCLLCNAAPIHDEEGRLCGYRGITSDITQGKANELRTRMLATAIDQSVDGVLIADMLGYVEYANPAYLRLIGRSAEAIVGSHIRENGIISTDAGFRELLLEKLHAGRQWTGRGSNHNHSGRRFDEEVVLTPILNQHNQITKVVIGLRDISQELLLEQQSRQSQKMQAIGTMAGGIAHDFNNILSAILGYADLTLEDLPEGSASHDNLVEVVQAANRARDLVQQILAFSRQSASSLQLLSPRTITREVMKLMRATIPAMIEIHEDFRIGDLFVRMDPTQYHQVVMNLLVNASHAIGEQSGTIEITLDEVVIETQQGAVAPGHYVCLSVADSGCGMTPEVQERIFEPFFTTKAVDEGTGMGLAAVHGIISAINGCITVSSEVGKGSRFDVYMPLANERPERCEVAEESARRGNERVLMVDDEPVQTALMKQMLTRLGYQVTSCNSSRDALALLRENPQQFDAVITDQNMPGMTGEQLSVALLQIRPDLPMLMCTGYSRGFGPDQARAAGIREYVMKPVSMKQIGQALAQLFTAAAPDAVE